VIWGIADPFSCASHHCFLCVRKVRC